MINEEYVEKAVNFWVDKITSNEPQFNGDYSGPSILASIMGTLLKKDSKPTEEQIEMFKKELHDLIVTKEPYMIITDYDPDEILSEAAEKADIKPTVFPWKHTMFFENNGVYVKEGYGETKRKL